ncbi:hypothetical protein TCAL_04848 [Tigriopus californicus]|uniref:F-box domain-containing protein n=1 Tax=Tigriopus californicus TaxID=6832 RepID=A0A553NXT3_TIGCA|nr:uncharacterized protein LOC131887132 [Tigriopus californicus]XP_059091644.1 uncharacterized protein LOC131887132 [Tigriopus californicus]TRY70234.1 hypothetical protein TCAL_04848 [Tigriopus californicus]|eukprot:TCALIF_04848-PA protein Name:"Protein of unknown function" AED:0.36 eAED:0.36 QI:0/1/0.5/1/1/1/2/36/579
MSYLRSLNLQPESLKQTCLDVWMQHVIRLIRDEQIILRGKLPELSSPSCQSFSGALKVLHSFKSDQMGQASNKNIIIDPPALARYLNAHLPPSVQEESFHRGANLVKKELFFDMFPPYFGLLWRPSFHFLDLPPIRELSDRVFVLDLLTTSPAEGTSEEHPLGSIETAKFRLFDTCELNIEESYLMKRVLRRLTNLKSLVLWWACDDTMLNIIGANCDVLESLDVWRSSSVTDLGLKMLLSSDQTRDGSSVLCHSLKSLGVKETSVTHIGCVIAIIRCKHLEFLNFSHTTVVKDFFLELRKLDESSSPHEARTYALKSLFVPITHGVVFRECIHAFPNLEDLQLWTPASQIRDFTANDFPKLTSLLFGGLHSARLLERLVEVVGTKLTTLKIESVLTDIPLNTIGQCCQNLVQLQVVNGRLSVGEHICSQAEPWFFANLKLLYFFLVHYVHNDMDSNPAYPQAALHCILSHTRQIEAVTATGCASFDDESLKGVLAANPMTMLKRFTMTGISYLETPEAPLPLTSISVIRLYNQCQQLKCMGDLKHWSVPPAERKQLSKKIQSNSHSNNGNKRISFSSL